MFTKLLNRFVKPEIIRGKSGKELLSTDCSDVKNQLSDEEMVLGDKVRKQLSEMKADLQRKELISVRAIFTKSVKYSEKKPVVQ